MTLQGIGRLLLLGALLSTSGCMLFLMKYQGDGQQLDTGNTSPPDQTDADVGSDDTGQADDPVPSDSGAPSDTGTGVDSGTAGDSGQGEEPPSDTGGDGDTGASGDTDSNTEEPPVCHDTGVTSG